MAATYAVFGVLAAATGANLQAAFQHPTVLVAFAALFVALPLMTSKVFLGIHWEALRLWCKRVPVFARRPEGADAASGVERSAR